MICYVHCFSHAKLAQGMLLLQRTAGLMQQLCWLELQHCTGLSSPAQACTLKAIAEAKKILSFDKQPPVSGTAGLCWTGAVVDQARSADRMGSTLASKQTNTGTTRNRLPTGSIA
jgi:hypothetical protein